MTDYSSMAAMSMSGVIQAQQQAEQLQANLQQLYTSSYDPKVADTPQNAKPLTFQSSLSVEEAKSSSADIRDSNTFVGYNPNVRYTGIVDTWNGAGYGWIKCPEATRIYGKHIYVHRADASKEK